MAKKPVKKAAPKGKAKAAKKPVAKAAAGDTPATHKMSKSTEAQIERLHALRLLEKAAPPPTKPSVNGVDLSGQGGKRGPATREF
jgi:hypothetical protein